MPYFRKKPIVVEARLFGSEDLKSQEALAGWCNGLLRGIRLLPHERVIRFETPEGDMEARFGDYIIKGVKGEFYPCKPDIFEATYDPA